jgi:hypothetical protein
VDWWGGGEGVVAGLNVVTKTVLLPGIETRFSIASYFNDSATLAHFLKLSVIDKDFASDW